MSAKFEEVEYSQSIRVTQSNWARMLIGTMREAYSHGMEGKHGGFTGRRYRRGKNRCSTCGATNDAPSRADSFINDLGQMFS